MLVALFVIYLFVTGIAHSVEYEIWASNNTLQCLGATSDDSCIFHCDVVLGYFSFNCFDAGKCVIYCEATGCMQYGTLIAVNSNNGGLLFDSTNGNSCMQNAEKIDLPSSDNATIISGDQSLYYAVINGGTNTQNIHIDCSQSINGDLDCYAMTINAQNANNIYIDCHNLNRLAPGSNPCGGITVNAQNANYLGINVQNSRLDGSPGDDVMIYCPQNSIYTGPEMTSCIIDASNAGYLQYITLNTMHGIPFDLWIYADSDDYIDNIRVISTDPSCDQTQSVLFNDNSPCWNTKAPTNDITGTPTFNPSTTTSHTFSTYSPSDWPSNAPSGSPSNIPSNAPTLFPFYTTPNASYNPSAAPTRVPTSINDITGTPISPSKLPSHNPTRSQPTIAINSSLHPTQIPTNNPSKHPTFNPTTSSSSQTPTNLTTITSSINPTVSPSKTPTFSPTYNPTPAPTDNLPAAPTEIPTVSPTDIPTLLPTLCVSQNSYDGKDLIMPINMNIYIELKNINQTIYYLPDANTTYIECNDKNNVAATCYIDCISEGSCSGLDIIPYNDHNYLSELLINCHSKTSCDSVKINISDVEIDEVTLLCASKTSCQYAEIYINVMSNGELYIHCNESLSCDYMTLKIDLISIKLSELTLDYKVTIYCYDDYSCDNLLVDAHNMIDINLYIYKYSDNIHIKYDKPDNLNVVCGNDNDKRYIQYDNRQYLTPKESILLSGKEYYSGHLPCDQNIHIECTSNLDFPQECIYQYQLNLNTVNFSKIEKSREYALCLWLEVGSMFNIICGGNCGDYNTYYHHNISMEFDIMFNFNEAVTNTNNTQSVCNDIYKHFGTVNNTKNTLNDIDFILYTLLSLYTTPLIKQITSFPRTILISNQTYFNCQHNMNDRATPLFTTFTVQSINDQQEVIQKLFVSDSVFYNKTIILLNKYFGDSIVIFPIRNYVNTETVIVTNEFFNESYYYILPLFGILVILIIFACIHHKCSSKTCSKNCILYRHPYHSVDEVKVGKILSYGLQIFDIYTDIMFIYDILINKFDLINIIISLSSVSFIVISYIINIILFWKIKDNKKFNYFIQEWIEIINAKIFIFLLIISGSLYHTLSGISSSKIFGLTQFSAPLHFGDNYILLSYKFKYIILIETIPQILIQSIWLILFNDTNIYGNK